MNSCLGRQQKSTKFNPLKGELTPHWTQPLSSNIGLLNIEDLWPAKMHLESFYITCLCVTPVLRSRGLIYKPEEKERRVAANARHSADGLEWPGGEQKGYWVMEGYWWQHQGTAICQQQYLVFPSPHPVNPSGGAFCVTVRWHADRSLTDKHRTPRHRALLAFPLRVYSFPSTYRVPGQDPVLVLLFPVASVDVETVLLQFLSAQGEALGGVFSLLHSLYAPKSFLLVIISSRTNSCLQGLRKGREKTEKISWKVDLWAAKPVGHIVLLIQILHSLNILLP